MRTLLVAAASIAALSLSACASPCEELAEKICACEGSLSEVDACERRAAQTEDILDPGDDAQAVCESLLETCDCHRLDTPQGKRDCGLAE